VADSAEDIPKTVDSTSNNDGRSGQLNISRTAVTVAQFGTATGFTAKWGVEVALVNCWEWDSLICSGTEIVNWGQIGVNWGVVLCNNCAAAILTVFNCVATVG